MTARASARSIVDQCDISIVVSEGPVRGTLRLPTGDAREVVGATCSEVAGALALVLALQAKSADGTPADTSPPTTPPHDVGTTTGQSPALVSPQASASSDNPTPSSMPNGASPQTPVTNDDPAQASRTNGDSTSTSAATSATGAATAAARVPPNPANSNAQRRDHPGPQTSSLQLSIKAFRLSTPTSSRARWTFGAGAAAAFGPAPVGLFGAALFAEYQPRSSIPHSVLLGAEAAPYATASVQAATARYRWGATRAAACVQTLRFEASSALWLCAEVVVGAAMVTGQERGPITHSRTVVETWLSAGPSARFRFKLSEGYSLDLAAGAGVPVIRHRTVFYEPNLVLHETGNVAGFLAIQLGRHSGG